LGRSARSFHSSISPPAGAGSSTSATAALPLWVFDEGRRVPDTTLLDYLALTPLIWAGPQKLVGKTIPCKGALYQRLVQPLLLAALNVEPARGLGGSCRRVSCGRRCWRAVWPAGR